MLSKLRADRVGGQIGADVDVESEERPNRGRVLGAIEPLERATPRVGVAVAAASSVVSSAVTSAMRVAASGFRAASLGGIRPVRSLRTFSRRRPRARAAFATSNAASDSSPRLTVVVTADEYVRIVSLWSGKQQPLERVGPTRKGMNERRARRAGLCGRRQISWTAGQTEALGRSLRAHVILANGSCFMYPLMGLRPRPLT